MSETVAITSRGVGGNARINFLPNYFGTSKGYTDYLRVENMCYALADKMIEGYGESSGFWKFRKTSNGAGYIYPDMYGDVTVNNPDNGASETMSAKAAGLCITILVLNRASRYFNSQRLANRWEWLMDYVRDHAEYAKISRILD